VFESLLLLLLIDGGCCLFIALAEQSDQKQSIGSLAWSVGRSVAAVDPSHLIFAAVFIFDSYMKDVRLGVGIAREP